MNIPEELRYSSEHEWARRLDDGPRVRIGITDFAQKELGDIVYVEMPQEGDQLTQMESFGTIEAVKTVEDLYSPLTGEVLEVNALLQDQPTLINSSPYEDGWIVRLRIANPKELDALLSHEAYRERITEAD